MTRQLLVNIAQGANLEGLRAELRAAVGSYVAGVNRTPYGYFVILEDDAPPADEIAAAIEAVIDAHDPDALTDDQRAQPDYRVRQIPGWATWDEDQAVGWITSNVTDLASAKTALIALARMVIALRDAQWPGLGG